MRMVELGTVCEIKNGYAFKSSEFLTEGVPLIRISNFDNGPVSINKSSVFVDQENLNTKRNFLVEKGDVLIALSGATTGKYGFYDKDEPSLLNQRIGLLKSGVSQELNDRYFYHYLSILQDKILRKAGGAAQPNISTKAIGEFQIPLPPLPQQKKIAAILDEADSYRQKTKALITKYDELTQSLFLDMFGDPVTNPKGWDEFPINKYINIKHGFAFKSEFFVDESDYTLLTPGNYYEQGGYKNQGQKQKYYNGVIPKDYILKEGDVLVAMTEQAAGLLGSTLFVPSEGVYLHNQRLGLFEYKLDINPTFIYTVFNQDSFRKRVHKDATGTKVRHTSPSKLMNIEIGFPPITLQNQFAERVEAIEVQKAQAQAELVKAEELFGSLLQGAFKNGKN